jgi:NADH-quinone oxidoreductase subunit C
MTPDQIIARLQQRFGAGIVAAEPGTTHPHAVVAPESWVAVATFLRDEPELKFDYLRVIAGVDYPADNKLVSVCELLSTTHRHAFAVKVNAARDNPHVPSVAAVWPAAEWHERETFDLLGIVYDGHPRMERILLPDDWQGHPLRKDYVFPDEKALLKQVIARSESIS